MRSAIFFQVLLNILFALLLLAIGILLMLTPYSQAIQHFYELYVAPYPWVVLICGFSFIIIGTVTLSWSIPLLFKGHYERVSGMLKVWVDEGVVERELAHFLQNKFNNQNLVVHAYMHRNKLYIGCELPTKAASAQVRKEMISKLKEELRSFLSSRFAYNVDFSLSFSYKPHKPLKK
jgi:hypothetical protein